MNADRFSSGSTHLFSGPDTAAEAIPNTRTYLHPTIGPGAPEGGLVSDPVPGDLLADDYRLLRRLPGGGMGIVYQAWWRGRRRTVVLKLLAAEFRQDAALSDALRGEAAALSRLRHANVVRALEHGDLPDGSPYLVLEWMAGGSVAEAIRQRGALAARQATLFAAAACRGLAAVHRAGLLHLDIKPANLLLDRRGRLKIADFGLAVEVNDSGKASRASGIGTPGYFAPEQATALPVDARTDVYSLGVAYFEMLTGRLPFDGQTVFECARKHALAPVPCPRSVRPNVPEACAAIARRAMAKNPRQRYADTGQMLLALEEALASVRQI
jgi:serine/threonine protein kinase